MFTDESENIWQSGKFLVIRKGAQLPDHCIKTNKPAHGKRFRATLYWYPPILALLILLSPIVYGIVVLAVRKKAIVYVGVTEEILRKRRRAILGGWIVGIFGFFFFTAALSLAEIDLAGLLLLLSLSLMFGGLMWGMTGASIVKINRIESDYIWLQGASRNYLSFLPELNLDYQYRNIP